MHHTVHTIHKVRYKYLKLWLMYVCVAYMYV